MYKRQALGYDVEWDEENKQIVANRNSQFIIMTLNETAYLNITGLEEGRQLFVLTPDSKFNLANMMRTHLDVYKRQEFIFAKSAQASHRLACYLLQL